MTPANSRRSSPLGWDRHWGCTTPPPQPCGPLPVNPAPPPQASASPPQRSSWTGCQAGSRTRMATTETMGTPSVGGAQGAPTAPSTPQVRWPGTGWEGRNRPPWRATHSRLRTDRGRAGKRPRRGRPSSCRHVLRSRGNRFAALVTCVGHTSTSFLRPPRQAVLRCACNHTGMVCTKTGAVPRNACPALRAHWLAGPPAPPRELAGWLARPALPAGDWIGVILNRIERTITFTKKGYDLGVAFEGVSEERLYPSVGFRTPDEEVSPGCRACCFRVQGLVLWAGGAGASGRGAQGQAGRTCWWAWQRGPGVCSRSGEVCQATCCLFRWAAHRGGRQRRRTPLSPAPAPRSCHLRGRPGYPAPPPWMHTAFRSAALPHGPRSWPTLAPTWPPAPSEATWPGSGQRPRSGSTRASWPRLCPVAPRWAGG